MMSRCVSFSRTMTGALVLLLSFASATLAGDFVWVQGTWSIGPSPCTSTVSVPVSCSNERALRELIIPLRVTEWTWDFPNWAGSVFFDSVARGDQGSAAVFDSLSLTFGEDSSEVLITFHSKDSFLAPGSGVLCSLLVLAETRYAITEFDVDSITINGNSLVTIDTSGAAVTPTFQLGQFASLFDPPFDTFESVWVGDHEFKKIPYDTIVSCHVSYMTIVGYAYRSVPLRLDAGIPGAYMVPGSVRLTEWSDSTYFDSVTVFESPDSLGLWLQFYDGPQKWCSEGTCSWVLCYFDVYIPANATGVLYIDTANAPGGTPLTFRDECPDDYPPHFGSGSITVDPTSIDAELVAIPGTFTLSQPFPNPFNPDVSISLTLSMAERVSLDVYDLLGRHVEMLWSGVLSAGEHEFTWSADVRSSGVYFIRAATPTQAEVRKALLLK